jgi:aspartyl-tRNA(Asn)/glutamyl-tRNA(Gln) amidotransferase subunit A
MYSNYTSIKEEISNGVSVKSIVESYLKNIEKHRSLNAFLEVFEDTAMAQAEIVDEKIKNGSAGRLAGMVIGIKDNICYKEHQVSASSKILENFESLFSATVIERLLAEDAIIIGRTNCDEFAMGSSNENSAFGKVLNPRNEKYVPGGSSGGSAAAVAANLCTVSLGSDTGGSIRQPASFTGTFGFKPSYGRVSRHGLIAYASSFDQIGPFANDLDDIALIMEVIAGKDEYDNTVSSKPVENYTSFHKEKPLKLAYITDCLTSEGLDKEIKSKLEDTIDQLKNNGHEVSPVSFDFLPYMVPTYYVLTTAEASSNLSRFDGVHFGYRSANAKGVDETYVKSRSEGFGPEVKRRIMTGTFVLSQGFYDAYYAKAQKVRRLIKDKTEAILAEYDAILLPTCPSTAFEAGQVKDNIQMYLQDIFTVHANLAGNPAISIPVANHSNGLPYGLQLIGKNFQEGELLRAANVLLKNS